MLTIRVVSIFPELFDGPLSISITARAAAPALVRYAVVDLRDHTHDKHRTVDDAPYGGGAGMVMKPGPFFEAVEAVGAKAPIVLLSARGRRFRHDDAERFSRGDRRHGAPAAGRDERPGERPRGLVLREGNQRAELHAATGVSRAQGAR